ncbi:MAG: cytochrome c oxidase subunit II [Pararhodobacter sp.]
MSTLAPAGPVAGQIAWLWWAMLGGSAVLTVMVLALVALGFRAPREQSEKRWVFGMGIAFSLTVLTVTLAGALVVGERILPRGPAFEVHAESRQWMWRFETPETGVTVDVMHVPAGQPIDVLVTSIDVIHSFWVPRLGGKIDAIPGRVNRLRLQVDTPGEYAGACAEFCGLDHGVMSFTLVAHETWPPTPEALSAEIEVAR